MLAPTSDPLRALPDPLTWDRLTDASWKQVEYAADGLFREGWADLQRLTGDQGAFATSCMTSMILKPETLARRSSGHVIELLRERGFRIALAKEIDLDGRNVQAVWRYQMDTASDDRILLRTLPLAPTKAVYLLLQRDPHGCDAARSLSKCKGSPHAHLQKPEQLRSQLDQPNPTISFIHAPDDPADFIRELPVWLNYAERRQCRPMFSSFVSDAATRLEEAKLTTFEKSVESYHFDVGKMVENIRKRAAATGELQQLVCSTFDSTSPLDLAEYCRLLDAQHAPLKCWDNFFFASQYITADVRPLRFGATNDPATRDVADAFSAQDILALPLLREAREAWDVQIAEVSKRYGRVERLGDTLEQKSGSAWRSSSRVPISLIGLAGAGGSGKDTVIGALLARLPKTMFVPHVTTRKPRPGELEGKNYFYVSDEEFDEISRAGDFVYIREIEGRGRYGLLKDSLICDDKIAIIKESPIALFDICQSIENSAENIKSSLFYLIPPDPIFPSLLNRVIQRDGMPHGDGMRRLLNTLRPSNAMEFLSAVQIYEDHQGFSFIINDDIDRAVSKIISLVT